MHTLNFRCESCFRLQPAIKFRPYKQSKRGKQRYSKVCLECEIKHAEMKKNTPKVCSICGTEKEPRYFYHTSKVCKECQKEKNRKPVRVNKKGYVYFIQAKQLKLIKIGWTENLLQRYTGLQGESPDALILLGAIPAITTDEPALHRRFAEYRHHGEWFNPGKEILDFIKGYAWKCNVLVFKTENGIRRELQIIKPLGLWTLPESA